MPLVLVAPGSPAAGSALTLPALERSRKRWQGSQPKPKERTMSTLRFNVFQITTDKQKWPRIGTALVNRDGSFNVYLDQNVTLTGPAKLQIRVRRAKSVEADGTPE